MFAGVHNIGLKCLDFELDYFDPTTYKVTEVDHGVFDPNIAEALKASLMVAEPLVIEGICHLLTFTVCLYL